MRNSWWKEMWLAASQSLKMLVKGRTTIALLAVGVILLVGMLSCMDEVKEEKSKISIGIVDEDNSVLSRAVVTQMSQMDLYEVTTGSEEELLVQLEQGELSAVCVLKKKYASSVERGKSKKLVTIYEPEGGEALLLSDILAGTMMDEICIAKGYDTLVEYQKNAGKSETLTLEEYRAYVGQIKGMEEFEFSFDVQYVSVSGEQAKKPEQSLVYQQAIFAIFALMTGVLSLYSVMPFRKMHYGRLAGKIKTLPISGSALYFGSALGAFLIPGVFGVLFLALYDVRNEIRSSVAISLLVCTSVYICVIVCMMLFAAYGIKNRTVYQMGMLGVILVFGVFGLVSIVDGILLPEGTVTWIPNGWYVRKMTEIIYNTR